MKVVFGGLVGIIVVFSFFYNNFDLYLKIFGGILICVVGMESLKGLGNTNIRRFYCQFGLWVCSSVYNNYLHFLVNGNYFALPCRK